MRRKTVALLLAVLGFVVTCQAVAQEPGAEQRKPVDARAKVLATEAGGAAMGGKPRETHDQRPTASLENREAPGNARMERLGERLATADEIEVDTAALRAAFVDHVRGLIPS